MRSVKLLKRKLFIIYQQRRTSFSEQRPIETQIQSYNISNRIDQSLQDGLIVLKRDSEVYDLSKNKKTASDYNSSGLSGQQKDQNEEDSKKLAEEEGYRQVIQYDRESQDGNQRSKKYLRQRHSGFIESQNQLDSKGTKRKTIYKLKPQYQLEMKNHQKEILSLKFKLKLAIVEKQKAIVEKQKAIVEKQKAIVEKQKAIVQRNKQIALQKIALQKIQSNNKIALQKMRSKKQIVLQMIRSAPAQQYKDVVKFLSTNMGLSHQSFGKKQLMIQQHQQQMIEELEEQKQENKDKRPHLSSEEIKELYEKFRKGYLSENLNLTKISQQTGRHINTIRSHLTKFCIKYRIERLNLKQSCRIYGIENYEIEY